MAHRVALTALATFAVVGLLGCGGSRRATVNLLTGTTISANECPSRSCASAHRGLLGPLIDSGTNRSCGYLTVGKGWRIKAVDAESCDSARRLMRAYLVSNTCLKAERHLGSHCSVQGATCLEVPRESDKALVWCVDRKDLKREATATSVS
jgi:hypothetical protein